MDAGILPIKDPVKAKRRLAESYDDATRISIAQALLEDALWLCENSPFLEWLVVSDSSEVLAAAEHAGLGTLSDAGNDLNAALRAAVEEVAGARSVAIVPGDIPLATPDDLQDILDTGETSEIVVVPSGADGGTNALFLRPPSLLPPHFGPASLQAHLKAAEAGSHRCTVLALDRMARDLDRPEDIPVLLSATSRRPSKTLELLARLSD